MMIERLDYVSQHSCKQRLTDGIDSDHYQRKVNISAKIDKNWPKRI